MTWHTNAIAPQAKSMLADLRHCSVIEGFYLAGGTGLALHFGHRRSIDLDFFSTGAFNEETLLKKVERASGISLIQKDQQTLHAIIQGVKVSFLGYNYPLLYPTGSFNEVDVADARDIAGMKISAILSRGKKRDFIDLYVAARHYGMTLLLELFGRKYARTKYNLLSVLKSLTYFEDAEEDPMPDMLSVITWEEVKQFLRDEVPSYHF